MKEFNLELAKAGKPVCTRSGKTVRIVCFDRQWEDFPILALVLDRNVEMAERYTNQGKTTIGGGKSDADLMMATEKKEGWINLFRDKDGIEYTGLIYQSYEEAVNKEKFDDEKIATIKIKWEG